MPLEVRRKRPTIPGANFWSGSQLDGLLYAVRLPGLVRHPWERVLLLANRLLHYLPRPKCRWLPGAYLLLHIPLCCALFAFPGCILV